MENKNSKSESYIVIEAENIINNYLKERELGNIEKYYHLQNKYKKMKVLLIAMFITICVSVIVSIIIK